MKVGFQSIIFGPQIDDIEWVLNLVAGIGYQGIEFSQRPERIRFKKDGTSHPIEPEKLRFLLKERELTFLGIAGGTLDERMNFCDGYPKGSSREAHVSVHGKSNIEGKVQHILEPLYLYVEQCSTEELLEAVLRGFDLALHPHVYKQNHRISDAKSLMTELASCPQWNALPSAVRENRVPLSWLPDTAHLYIAGENIVNALQLSGRERVAAVHLKDWDAAYGRSYHRYAKGFTELGSGDVRPERALRELQRQGYSGWVVVEQDHTRTNPLRSALCNAEWLADYGVRLNKREEYLTAASQHVKTSVLDTSDKRELYFGDALARAEFSRAMSQASGQKLSLALDGEYSQSASSNTAQSTISADCYQTIAQAMYDLCDCYHVTIWACGSERDEMSLLAVYPFSADASQHVILRSKALSGIAIDKLAVESFDLAEKREDGRSFQWPVSGMDPAPVKMFAIPVLNEFNHHHVRFLVSLLPRQVEPSTELIIGKKNALISRDALFAFGQEMARAVDASLNDECSYASAKVNVLANTPGNGLKQFLIHIRDLIQEKIECEGVTIFLLDATKGRLEERSSTGIKWNETLPIEEQFYPCNNETTTGRVWIKKEPLLLRDVQSAFPHQARSRETGPGVDPMRDNLLFLPLIDRSGEVIGIIRCRNKKILTVSHDSKKMRSGVSSAPERIFTDDDAAIVEAIGQASVPHIQLMLNDIQRVDAVKKLSHELSMPMVAIRGAIDWLRHDMERMIAAKEITKFRYDYPGDIDSWAQLMVGLIGNADIYGRKHTQIAITPSPTFLLADVVAPAVRQVSELLKEREFDEWNIDYSDLMNLPRLHVDRNRLQQVMFNLFSNAIKYAFNDPALFSIQIATGRTPSHFEIYFRDSGPGIQAGHENSIFEEGVRGPGAVNDYVAGQGLGLWVVRRIIEAHGGTVRLTQTEKPTEITISLPTSLASAPPRRRSETSQTD